MGKPFLQAVSPFARTIYDALLQFFASSMFFILLGIGFLIAVFRLLDSTHPSFIFLLAILGVSIVLYGTGTQGAGSAEVKNIPIKVVVAGGAGALAAIFGYGVAWLGKDIKGVFDVPHQYARVTLNLYDEADPAETRDKYGIDDLRKLHVTAVARSTGKPLHLLALEDHIEILVPVTYFPEKSIVCITLTLPPNKSLTGKPNCPSLTWKKNEGGAESDLITHVAEGKLPLAPPRANRVDENNNPVPQDGDLFR